MYHISRQDVTLDRLLKESATEGNLQRSFAAAFVELREIWGINGGDERGCEYFPACAIAIGIRV